MPKSKATNKPQSDNDIRPGNETDFVTKQTESVGLEETWEDYVCTCGVFIRWSDITDEDNRTMAMKDIYAKYGVKPEVFIERLLASQKKELINQFVEEVRRDIGEFSLLYSGSEEELSNAEHFVVNLLIRFMSRHDLSSPKLLNLSQTDND